MAKDGHFLLKLLLLMGTTCIHTITPHKTLRPRTFGRPCLLDWTAYDL